MPKFDTHNGTITTRPSKHGYIAVFDPYPAKAMIEEEGSDEAEALGNLVESLNDLAIEARNDVAGYLKKQMQHQAKLAKGSKKGKR